jgi:hypothetical protein
MSKETAIATVETKTALATLNQEDLLADLQDSGVEDMGIDDIAIPRIKILQSNSPIVLDGSVEGAKAGKFYNTATGEVSDKLNVIPCSFQKAWLEWAPKPSNKLVKIHDEQSATELLQKCHKDAKHKDITPDGNTLAMSCSQFCVIIKENGSLERVVIDFASTQIKKSRKWNASILSLQVVVGGKRYTAPMYSQSYIFTTTLEKNTEGQWFGFVISTPTPLTDASIYQFAKQFRKDSTSGAVKVQEPIDEEEVVAGQPEVSDKF